MKERYLNMNKKTNRRCRVRIISYLSALILTLSIWGITATVKQNQYARIITASRQQALSDLNEYMNNINISLSKSLYCHTKPMLSNMASSLWREATGAKNSLSHLGDSEIHLLGTYKFLSQVGDYTMYLNKKVAAGGEITADEYNTLKKLQSYAEKYSQQINYMQDLMLAGNLSFDDIDASMLNDTMEIVKFNDAADDSEQNLSDYPTLIYDGPFSDGVENKESEMLKNLPAVTKDKAKNIACNFLNAEPDKIEDAGDEESNLPSFTFQYGSKTIAITKQGGYVRYLYNSDFADEQKIDIREGIKKGRAFLEKIGYYDMQDNYYSISDGIATVNFAYNSNDICYYPDLIKVGISLNSGEIVSFDATNYLINHKNRDINLINISKIDLKDSISPKLTVKTSKPAVIPTDYGKEIFTVEHLCKSKDGQDILVYINPETKEEEDILILTYSDDGILTR